MFLFTYNLQEPSGIFTFSFMIFSIQISFPSKKFSIQKLEKLKYKYYNVVAIYIQDQLYHEIQYSEIYQINKLKKSNLE